MSLDLSIVGGTVIDGTGSPARRADVGIKDGIVVSVTGPGGLGPAARTIDAEGAIVAPGFVDIHSHYDGQASWDGDMLPSAAHGVTTAVMGNCGVGFAPCRARDRERLIRLFEGVEDIPGTALTEGLSWKWESFGEYLDAIDAIPRTMDVAAYLTHDALRVFVMGERAVESERANDDDLRAMEALVTQAMNAGAVGVSTGRTDNHRAIDGSHTPASEASDAELAALARAMGATGRGLLQAVSDFDMERGPSRFEGEFDVLERFAEASGGRPLTLSLMQRDLIPTQWRDILRRVERANARGLDFHVQVAPRGIGVILGLEATFHPFIGFPTFKGFAHLPLAERVREMRKPEVRAKILSEKSDKIAGDGSAVPPLADRLLGMIDMISLRMFPLGRVPDYEPKFEASIGARALATQKPPLECIYDALLEDDGHALLYFPVYNYADLNLDAVGEMLHHPTALPGLADGGAHCGTICDASMPTYFLMHWARDREKQRFSLERAVELLTRTPAELLGFRDRGVLAPGKRGDVIVFDHAKLALAPPRLVRDLPAGGKRFLQDATGYRATVVRGEIVAQAGRLTGAKPGRVARLR
jgi:N-acyl-D-aspartate/D-glutamate deacylase